MEYRVHISNSFFTCDSVKDCADGIGNSAEQNPEHSGNCKNFNGLLKADNDEPSHKDIKNHRKLFEFVVVNGGKGCGNACKSPFRAENYPGKNRIDRAHCGKQNRGIGSDYKKINGAVVYDLHYFFCKAGFKSVIYA